MIDWDDVIWFDVLSCFFVYLWGLVYKNNERFNGDLNGVNMNEKIYILFVGDLFV